MAFTVATVFDDHAWLATMYIDRDTYFDLWVDSGSFRIGVVPDPGADVAALAADIEDRCTAPLAAILTRRAACGQGSGRCRSDRRAD